MLLPHERTALRDVYRVWGRLDQGRSSDEAREKIRAAARARYTVLAPDQRRERNARNNARRRQRCGPDRVST